MDSFDQRTRQAGIAGLYILCAGAFLSPAAVSAGSALLAVAFLILATRDHGRPDIVPVLVIGAFFGFLLLGTLAAALDSESSQGLDWETLKDWLQLLLFVPFAAFLRADASRFGRLLLLALASLIVGMLWRLDWSLALDSPARLLTMRQGYGLTAIGFALLTGTAFLGLVALRSRWWRGRDAPGRGFARLLLWLIALAAVTQGFVQAQSRGSWLALVAAAGIGIVLARCLTPAAGTRRPTHKAALLVAGGAVVALLALNAPRFVERWHEGYTAAVALASGELADPSRSSLGQRWYAQLAGIALWTERPWLGWGPASSRSLMEASGAPNVRSKHGEVLKHLHNTYLEIAVQFGAIGLLLFLAMVLMLIRGLWRAVRDGRIPADYGVFLLTAWAYSLVWGLFDYRAVHQDWRVYWILLAGASLSWTAARREADAEAPKTGPR